ncbi:MAG TPA: secretin N-terminal domain-containing protein, partial [Rhizomicrobium sp.]|nr:secretin N-terminal domain-containing protein [Rhizomicrobium sp.]
MSSRLRWAVPLFGAVIALLCAGLLAPKLAAAQDAAKSSLPLGQIGDSDPGRTTTATMPNTTPSASEIIKGTGKLVRDSQPARVSSTTVSDDGQITLNFVNADVRDVAKAVLGDFLGLNYVIGSSVQGTVTIQTSRPLARADVLPLLEQTLRLNGLALVRSNDVYKIMPIADAPREATTAMSAGTSEPGYGGEIVPLKYVGATEMLHLLEPMQPQGAIIHADPSRNVLIVEGTQAERAAVVSQVSLFDVDWLAGMSFALFTPQYTDARGLAR